ncbi:MAG: hypothetical protein KAR45_19940 [Desulfobacteraceae bacterium]|nr:hypothetical protein [Desulfobacteraceae bacterium]
MQIRLSKHFVENWRIRVGNEPSVDAVNAIIVASIPVQKGKRFMNGKTLSYYWHPELNLILLIDHFNNTAVSVLSEANKPKKTRQKSRKSARQFGYIPMTMHRAGI